MIRHQFIKLSGGLVMNQTRYAMTVLFAVSALLLGACSGIMGDQVLSEEELACLALTKVNNLTITSAEWVPATDSTPQYCYAKGVIAPAIGYHVQLPLPENWNGRFLKWGDGGKDGDLDFADHRVAEGYAVANSNMGHDNVRNRAHPSALTTGRRKSISDTGRYI